MKGEGGGKPTHSSGANGVAGYILGEGEALRHYLSKGETPQGKGISFHPGAGTYVGFFLLLLLGDNLLMPLT
jgi:hypothetical protein